ncbi:MAG: hypothetical protein K0S07_1586 [Chlamydiales bacterium]|jgi:predicted phosphate transport protein (TIGR00153 family)|nr:hypothetical protein [Chlamydiales bacterium]
MRRPLPIMAKERFKFTFFKKISIVKRTSNFLKTGNRTSHFELFMLNILKLFGKSPFAPLKSHMEKVAECVSLLQPLIQAFREHRQKDVEQMAESIAALEKTASLIKGEIYNHLPSSWFLSFDRASFLEILALQSSIGAAAEEIAATLTLKEMANLEPFQEEFAQFFAKSYESFQQIRSIIAELDDLLESSFGGAEALRVKQMIQKTVQLGKETFSLQRKLLKKLFQDEGNLSLGSFYQWQKVISSVQSITDDIELLAERIGMALNVF